APAAMEAEGRGGTRPGRGPGRPQSVPPQRSEGRLKTHRRDFPVQRLTLPRKMVDLNPETERRVAAEADQLRTLYRTVTPERFWRGRFTRPGGGTEPGAGFGARRGVNGQGKGPHTGIDF